MSISESFQKRIRVEYYANGLWKQDYVQCTFPEMLMQMNECKATLVKIVLPHPSTGKRMNYMLVKLPNGQWTVKVKTEVIK